MDPSCRLCNHCWHLVMNCSEISTALLFWLQNQTLPYVIYIRLCPFSELLGLVASSSSTFIINKKAVWSVRMIFLYLLDFMSFGAHESHRNDIYLCQGKLTELYAAYWIVYQKRATPAHLRTTSPFPHWSFLFHSDQDGKRTGGKLRCALPCYCCFRQYWKSVF